MNDQSWINELKWQEAMAPADALAGDEVYTLTMGDFLKMPDVNFSELVAFDPHLRALLN